MMLPETVFHIFGIPVTDFVIFGWIVIGILVIFSILATRRMQTVPSGLQNWGELVVEGFSGLVDSMMSGSGRRFVPFIATIGLYTLLANLMGSIPGFKSPTADLNATLALGLIVFIVAHVNAALEKGVITYIKGYFEPIWWLFPLNIVGEVSKLLSHSFRLYGNMIGGAIIVGVVYLLAPWVVPVPIIGWFNIFVGVMQAAVFTLLAIVYIDVLRK